MATTNNYDNILANLQADIKVINRRLGVIEDKLRAAASTSEIGTSEARTNSLINDHAILINKLEAKLGTVQVPDDTRWYLENSEIEDFRANFAKLKAMVADVDSLYQNIVAYTARGDR